MKYEFDAEIKRLEGKIQWSVFYFPESAVDCFGSKGNIPVKITVDGHPFDHMLLGSETGIISSTTSLSAAPSAKIWAI